MIHLKIKALSVNQVWAGRRFKTPAYKKYEKDVTILLPKIKLPDPPYELQVECGFSNKASDLDNILKPLIDILQKKYNFNDKEIYSLIMRKMIVKKGNEYIKITINNFNINN